MLDRIGAYVTANGRALDVARFRHAAHGSPVSEVVDELVAFQNDDGGFGHALESDLRLPDSSATCTWVALGMLIDLGIGVQTPIVAGAIDYLRDSYDASGGRWVPVSEAVNEHPHGGWWHFDKDKGGTDIHQTAWNPTASLVGYLWHYGFTGAPDLAQLTARATAYLQAQSDTDLEMHELRCLVQLAQLAPAPHTQPLRELVLTAVNRIVERERAKWEGYGAQPLHFVESPDCFLYTPLQETVDANLDWVVECLGEDGAWALPYQWGRDEDAFAQLKPEITASHTVHRVTVLRAFGRL